MTVDANTASREALIALGGIGDEVADAIIQARPFSSIEELLSIPGIGRKTLERLKGQGLIVGGGRAPKEKTMPKQTDQSERQPFRMRLPMPISEDIGLGDVVKRVTSAFHIRHCGGCERRRVWLNRRFVFTRRGVQS